MKKFNIFLVTFLLSMISYANVDVFDSTVLANVMQADNIENVSFQKYLKDLSWEILQQKNKEKVDQLMQEMIKKIDITYMESLAKVYLTGGVDGLHEFQKTKDNNCESKSRSLANSLAILAIGRLAHNKICIEFDNNLYTQTHKHNTKSLNFVYDAIWNTCLRQAGTVFFPIYYEYARRSLGDSISHEKTITDLIKSLDKYNPAEKFPDANLMQLYLWATQYNDFSSINPDEKNKLIEYIENNYNIYAQNNSKYGEEFMKYVIGIYYKNADKKQCEIFRKKMLEESQKHNYAMSVFFLSQSPDKFISIIL